MMADSGQYRDEARSLLRDLMLWQRILHDAGASLEQEELFSITVGRNGRPVLRMRSLDAESAHGFVMSLFEKFPHKVQADIAMVMVDDTQTITLRGESDDSRRAHGSQAVADAGES
jgi:hypothetical protein